VCRVIKRSLANKGSCCIIGCLMCGLEEEGIVYIWFQNMDPSFYKVPQIENEF